MTQNKLHPLDSAVLRAVRKMNPQFASELPLLMVWGKEAMEKINAPFSYQVQYKPLTVANCQVELPLENHIVLDVVRGDYGCACSNQFDSLTSSASSGQCGTLELDGNTVVFYWTGNTWTSTNLSWRVQNNKLVFDGGFSSGVVTIKHICYPTDERGIVMVNEHSLAAISTYVIKNALEREKFNRHMMGKRTVDLRMDTTDLERKFWEEARWARAKTSEESKRHTEELASIINNSVSGATHNQEDELTYM